MSKLLPGENPILKSHPHWITIVKSLIVPAVLVIVVAVADFTVLFPQENGSGFYVPHLRTFLSLGVIALALLWVHAYSIVGDPQQDSSVADSQFDSHGFGPTVLNDVL